MYAGAKAIFYALSRSAALKRLASRHGLATPTSFASRFIAGETIDTAIEASKRLQANGLLVTLDHLGERVRTLEESTAASHDYVKLLEAIVAAGIERNISLKLTQLGIDIDHATCVDNLRRILEPASRQDCYVRIDMENSPYTERTLSIFETLWEQNYRNVGVALQAYLHRTEEDVRRMNTLGARVRLVKGAYKEPAATAYKDKKTVDAAFLKLALLLLDEGHYPAIATHDAAIIDAVCAHVTERHIARDRFEFQMLYGIRRDLQAALVSAGYRVRVYVPFGREWFPYFMRRLGERPANVGFVLRSLLAER
ncbi:MAG: proline dehydrogenase [Acidobacteria bacterium]|nr:proline dehydrogenase [Acidobacteriota bacterium]